jgi:hypothetical protein
MAEQTAKERSTEDLGTCIMGGSTDQPCPSPAVARWRGGSPLCEEHYREAVVQEESDELTLSLDLLEAFVYEVRGHSLQVLEENLERLQVGFQERLSDTNGLLRMLSDQADRHKGS